MSHINKELFGPVDYFVFATMLTISSLIGVWYAYTDRKRNNAQQFFLGERLLSIFPVAMSVFATIFSGIGILGIPAEIYRYGTQITVKELGLCLAVPTAAYLYLPVYHKLGLTSAYEYLEMRFHRVVRLLCSFVFILYTIVFISIVLYAPTLALSEVTGLRLSTSVITLGLVCTFYTSIGGIKAVVWTDVFQTAMMYVAMVVVLTKGVSDIGGLEMVWQRSTEGKRIEFFRFDFDPTIRHTFWSLTMGGFVTWMSNFAANQCMIQRFLSINTLKGAQRCLWINLPVMWTMLLTSSFSGLVVYTYYSGCDPIGAKIVNKPDQLFPRFVMDILGSLPGIPGLFVSGVFSGALSTVSSGVNSLAAVVLEDFIKGLIVANLSEKRAVRISRILALLFGLFSTALVLLADQLGGLLQTAITMRGVVGGPMIGVFTLGLFFPYANATGASVGFVGGLAVSAWFAVGSFVTKPFNPEAPRSYHNCTEIFYNATNIQLTNGTFVFPETHARNEHIFYPYKLSYMWFSFAGFLVVLIAGNVVSICTGTLKRADSKYLSPLVVWLFKTSSTASFNLPLKSKEKATAAELQSFT